MLDGNTDIISPKHCPADHLGATGVFGFYSSLYGSKTFCICIGQSSCHIMSMGNHFDPDRIALLTGGYD
jgi:hypothetical protein